MLSISSSIHLPLSALEPADSFLALDTAQFTLGNKPALPANCAEDPALGYLFPEPLQELFL